MNVDGISKLRPVLVLFIVLMLFSSMYNPTCVTLTDNYERVNSIRSSTLSYVPHSSILIQSNDEFESEGFTGNGTIIDPYVFEGYNITSTSSSIHIEDTDAYFIVSDCFLLGTSVSHGIGLDNVTNGVIQNNTIKDFFDGMWVSHCTNNSAMNNTILGNYHGLNIQHSSDISIQNNTLTGNDKGVNLYSCTEGTNVYNNTISGNTVGIEGTGSYSYFIVNNTISENNWDGVYLHNAAFIHIENNTVTNNSNGFNIQNVYFSTMTINTIRDNSDDGIYLQHSGTNSILNNTIWSNGRYGIAIISSQYNTFSHNILLDCTVEIYGPEETHWNQNITADNWVNGRPLGYFWNLTDGVISGSQYAHLILANCTRVTVEDNEFFLTKGITLGHSSFCILTNNTIQDSLRDGIWISSASENNIVMNNFIIGCSGNGLVITSSSFNNTAVNNVIASNDAGVHIDDFSFDNWVENNTLEDNRDGVRIDSYSEYNNVVNNTISYSLIYGIRCVSGTENNQFYLNMFVDNNVENAYDAGTYNKWNTTGTGNFWSDYDGTGVYPIPGGAAIDYHPFVYPPGSIVTTTTTSSTTTSSVTTGLTSTTETTSETTTSAAATSTTPTSSTSSTTETTTVTDIGDMTMVLILVVGGIGAVLVVLIIVKIRR